MFEALILIPVGVLVYLSCKQSDRLRETIDENIDLKEQLRRITR